MLNPQQSPTCKRSFQVGRDFETNCDAGRVSAEVAKTLALSEFEKYNTASLEQEASKSDEDFNESVKYFHEHDKDKGMNDAAE